MAIGRRCDAKLAKKDDAIAEVTERVPRAEKEGLWLPDGATRLLVHWELSDRMTTTDVETIRQRAREPLPDARSQIISDDMPQFIARDFEDLVRLAGMTHMRTSPYLPVSNGRLERWHRSLKVEMLRPTVPASLEDARRLLSSFVDHEIHHRLHSTLGYVTRAARH